MVEEGGEKILLMEHVDPETVTVAGLCPALVLLSCKTPGQKYAPAMFAGSAAPTANANTFPGLHTAARPWCVVFLGGFGYAGGKSVHVCVCEGRVVRRFRGPSIIFPFGAGMGSLLGNPLANPMMQVQFPSLFSVRHMSLCRP